MGEARHKQATATAIHLPELASFTRQLGAMLQSGVEILQALEIAARQPGNPRLEEVGRHLGVLMENGDTFAEAVTRIPDVFTPFYVQMARQGEADGVLGGALVSLADYLDQEIRQGPGGGGASGVAATGLVAALLGTTGAAIMGAAGFLAAGHILQWGAMGGPAALAWSGFMLVLGSGWLAWRASRGPSFCTICGRPMPPARGWKGGPRMCETCVRREVARLKAPARPQSASMPPAVSADGDEGLDGLPALSEPDPFAPAPEKPGRKFQL